MKILLSLACIAMLFFAACKKQNTKAEFMTTKSSFYLTEAVAFSNQSSNGKTYTWDFGDGTTSTEENPSHPYNKAGTFQVKLTAGNSIATKNIKINNGTASYEVNNQATVAVRMVSFGVDAAEDIVDLVEHGVIAVNGKSDTVYTSQPEIILGGYLNSTSIFFVAQPYKVTKFMHNKFAINGTTQIIIPQSSSNEGVKAFKKQINKTNVLKNLNQVIQ
jgi:PKD repeat protein